MSRERYTVYVDISAKIEDWGHDSVIAVANDHTLTLLIRAETKTAAAALLDNRDPAQFVLLAMFTYFAVRSHLAQVRRIVIDMDYSGEYAHRVIQRRLLELLRRDDAKFKGQWISFKNVAGSHTDQLARQTYRGNARPDGEITLAEILGILNN